jgi:hypothetical protein
MRMVARNTVHSYSTLSCTGIMHVYDQDGRTAVALLVQDPRC